MATIDLESDLRERWLPTEAQRVRARALLKATGCEYVYTAHLLLDKTFGFWTADVAVVALDGVFTDRLSAQMYLEHAGRIYHEKTGRKLTGGYAHHYLDSGGDEQAAVFEDIMCRFGDER